MPDRSVLAPIFTWRSAILRSDLPSTTRHILLTLACYMSEAGESAFPSTRRLAEDTGVHRDTVKRHLRQAAEAGWIVKVPRQRENGGSTTNIYQASVPPGCTGAPPSPRTVHPPRGAGVHPQDFASKELSKGTEPLVGEDADADVETVDNPYQAIHAHFNRCRKGKDLALTPGRKRVYRARLKRFTPAELSKAIEIGCSDPFWQGKNDRGTRYDYPENLLRNDERVSQLLDREETHRQAAAGDLRAAMTIYVNVVSGRFPEEALERDPVLVRLRARRWTPGGVSATAHDDYVPAPESMLDAFTRAYTAERERMRAETRA